MAVSSIFIKNVFLFHAVREYKFQVDYAYFKSGLHSVFISGISIIIHNLRLQREIIYTFDFLSAISTLLLSKYL